MLPTSGQLQGAKEDTEFNFIVHEPKDIMDRSKARSFCCSVKIYRIISVSDQMLLKIFCCRKGVVRAKAAGSSPETATSAAPAPPPAPAALIADTRVAMSSSKCVSSKLAETRLSSNTRKLSPCSCNFSTSALGLAGDTSKATVSKKASLLATAQPSLLTSCANSCAMAWTFFAIFFRPSVRWKTAYIAAMFASNTCAVQTLDVALSMRMCCSRVCSVSL
mmetsp:Transcript_91931/g.281298  ORF Transcript_91931/g.281298 Transcript_91931/m.281298 type:complete len:220 (-) Transcript_91931:1177-1836(-)